MKRIIIKNIITMIDYRRVNIENEALRGRLYELVVAYDHTDRLFNFNHSLFMAADSFTSNL